MYINIKICPRIQAGSQNVVMINLKECLARIRVVLNGYNLFTIKYNDENQVSKFAVQKVTYLSTLLLSRSQLDELKFNLIIKVIG